VPPYVASIAAASPSSASLWAGYGALAFNSGAVGGYVAFGFLADSWGRRKTTLLYYAGALVFTVALFAKSGDRSSLLVRAGLLGWFAAGQFTWMPAWLPELLPTRVRATGSAFVFNGPRFVAWIGPLVAGTLIVVLGGFRHAALACGSVYLLGLAAAPFLPETRGRPLPDG
jgi:MFS family permease